MTVAERVGRRIFDARKASGHTQESLGALLGVSDATVNRWEKGITPIKVPDLEQLAEALDKPMWYFLGIDPPPAGSIFGTDFSKLTPENQQVTINLVQSLLANQERQSRGRRAG